MAGSLFTCGIQLTISSVMSDLFLAFLTLACTLLPPALATPTAVPGPACDRAPPHAQPADAHYRLGVSGDPDLFLPGELYTVSLRGVDSGEGPTPFTAFSIWAELESKDGDTKDDQVFPPPSNYSLGVFQAYDAQTKAHEHCQPAVTNATAHPKIEIQVIWSAPMSVVDVCVRLCARAGPSPAPPAGSSPAPAAGSSPAPAAGTTSAPAAGPSILARKLCAAPAAPASLVRQPPIVEPCCACDEAKYEVTFEGQWSRNTHPRGFPPEGARAHFSDVIGASHTAQYRVWQEGRAATAGLRRLADDGTTTALEKELKAESDHIRTIIKARGISWQHVAGSGSPSTFAVFRVDDRHHLVSLAAKLAPSPDWIVGISALELCNANCSWRRAAWLPLYPYDAGTDGGIGYMSPRQPTLPPDKVRALRPDWPKDSRSPFYNPGGEMRPFARLRLTRLRLYEKSCDAVGPETPPEQVAEAAAGSGACATHEWGPWGPCSVSCGPGRQTRQREYVYPARAAGDDCRAPLTDSQRCHGPRRHCKAPTDYEPDPASSTGPCAVTAWSEWSPCEGCGVRARSRHYVVPRARKRCHVGYRARTVMHQAMPCDAGPCERPANMVNSTSNDWFFVDVPRGECQVTPWGDWSPCSAKCGRGRRLRTRLYVARDSRVQAELTRRLLREWTLRFVQLQGLDLPYANMTSDDPELEALVEAQLEKCQFTLTQQEALCDGEAADCEKTDPEDVCKLPVSVGPCRGYEERWFHDARGGACEPFGFTGCGGNNNNFRTREDCLAACRPAVSTPTPLATVTATTGEERSTPAPAASDNEVMQDDAPAHELETPCEVGPWQGWGMCFGECDFAIKLNYRYISHHPLGPNKTCPNIIKSRGCRLNHCRKVHPHASTEPNEEVEVRSNGYYYGDGSLV